MPNPICKTPILKPLLISLGAVLAVMLGLMAWIYVDYQRFVESPLNLPETGYTIEIEPGMSLAHVARRLHDAGVLDKPYYLTLLGRISGQASRIQTGEFFIAAGATPVDLMQELTTGTVVQYPVTIIEGWTFAQLRDYLATRTHLEHTLDDLDDSAVMTRLGRPDMHPEGRFLPDTYHFPKGTEDIEVLRRALLAMESRLQLAWKGRSEDLPLDTSYEALILASIVEKETAVPDERPRIAGVFIRRLRKGMRLQTDPTVIYGMGESYDGNIRRRDLLRDTPYNTYTRSGLPPTPIALPSGESIDAVLHPAAGNALYFVSRGDGSHVFSATLEEHNRAVRRYQLK